MKLDVFKKNENFLLSILTITLFGIFVGVKYDLIYELNDDAVIRNLLSGAYTGVPTAMNNQMKYLFSAVLSGLYRIVPSVQWFDIFLIASQYMCIWAVLYRLIWYCKTYGDKVLTAVAYLTFLLTFLLNHFVLPTYTVTSGMLAVTAIFIFVTEKDNEKLFFKSLVPIMMVVIAFCLRSEIMLMLLPFVAIAGMYRWSREEVIFTVDNFKKYFGIVGCMFAALAVMAVTDNMAYSSDEWQDFRSFFDDRTTVYDYYYFSSYEDNKEFLDSVNISKEQYALLVSYDYALDERINSEMMNSIAEHVQRTGAGLGEKLYNAVYGYKDQLIGGVATPYHTLTLLGYLLLLLAVNRVNGTRVLFMAAVIFFCTQCHLAVHYWTWKNP